MNNKVLITGATGSTGGHAITDLLQRGIPVRALVHNIDERSEKLSAQGVEIVQGDLSDFEAIFAALEGITGAYSFIRFRFQVLWNPPLFSLRPLPSKD